MPAGTPIDQIFNEPAIQAQFQRVSAQLDSFAAQMLKVQQANENTRAGNSFSSVSASIKEVQGELGKLKSVNDLLIKNELDLQRAIVATETARLKSAQAKLTEAKADTEVIKQLKIELDYEQKLAKAKTAPIIEPIVTPPISSTITTTNNDDEIASINATGVAVSDLEQQQAAGVVAANEWAAAQQAAAASTSIVDEAIITELTTYEALSQAIVTTKLELDSINTAIKNNASAFKSGLISEEQYVEEAAKLNIQQTELKQSLRATEAEFTAQAKIVAGTSGAYDLLNARYEEAKKNARDIAVAFGEDSLQAQKAAASAKALGVQLQNIDAGVGVSTRKVGGYSDAITGALSKGFGFIRQAAYILPGIGIAGIISAISDGIIKVVNALGLFDEAFDKSKTQLKAYNEVVEKGADGYGKAVTQVNELKEEFKLANEGYIKGDDVLKKYNDTIGKTVGFAKSLAEAQQTLIDKSPDFIKFTFLQAEAQAAANLAIQEASKATETRTKALTDFTDTGDAIVSYLRAFFTKSVGSGNIAVQASLDLAKKAQTAQDKQLTESKTRYDKFLELQTKFLDESGKLAKVKGFNFFGDKPDKDAKEAQSKFNDYLQSLIKARRDAQVQQLQDEAKFQQSIADLQNGGLGDNQRVIAEQKASAARLQIIKINAKAELDIIDAQENEAAKKYKDSNTKINEDTKISVTNRNSLLLSANKELNEAEALYQAERQNINVKANAAIIQEQVNTNIAIAKIRKEENDKLDADLQANFDKMAKPTAPTTNTELINSLVDAEQKAFEYRQTIRATNYAQQKQQVQQQYEDGKIDYKQYQDGLREIELANQKLILQDQITSQEAILAIYEKYGTIGSADAQKIKKLIAELKASLGGIKIDIDTSGLDKLQSKLQNIVNGIQQVSDLIGQGVNASVTTQKNALQALEDQQERNYEAEVTRVNNSTLTQEQQQAKLIKLDATRQAQKEANDRKSRAIDRQQAEFQKAATIMQIITTTALAVVSELAKHSFPGAIAAGVLGAAELAIAIATPVPTFEKGGIMKKEGIAQVSEKGAELAIEKDGTMFMTPEKRSLVQLKAGTKIIPHDEVDKVLYNIMLRNTANKINTPIDPLPSIALQQLKAMQQLANKKQVRPIVNINLDKYYFDNVKR